LHERLSRRGSAVADGLLDLGVELVDVVVGEDRSCGLLLVFGQLLAPRLEAGELAAEGVDALAAER
jgi:hypothetical protein